MNVKSGFKSILSVFLSLTMILSTVPIITHAAQSNEYVDPADSWLSSNSRTNELDVNSTTTYETQYCHVCAKDTLVITYRVPEYTKSGETALNRNVLYSDGTCIDGVSKGNLDDGTPGVDAFYTGYHWTKSVCQNCGTINSANGNVYGYNKNVYNLNSCDQNFFLDFDNTKHEYYNENQHLTTLKRGEYCKFCKGTFARATIGLQEHKFVENVDAQLGNNRFYVAETCDDCGYETSEYVVAKAVVSSYYGVEDGEAHTLTVNDLSDRGVKTSIRYGTDAENCTKTTAPGFVQPGYNTVYYQIEYSYSGETMTENGVSYVWILAEDEPEENGTIIVLPTAHEHEYHYLETVKPSCDELGYDRFQCNGCGDLDKRNYIPATGHNYEEVIIREATCKQGGLALTLCKNCGDYYQATTALGEHKYHTEHIEPTCRLVGYDEHICEICGHSYITNMTSLINHKYTKITKEPDCINNGYTTYTCTMCGSNYVDEYTDALGHDWDNGHTVTSSTCTGEGVIEYRCQFDSCSEKMILATAATGHTPGAKATCTEPQKCTVCGTVLTLPTGHTYKITKTNPTCTSFGFATHSCSNCSDSYISDYAEPIPHEYEESVIPPSCTTMGYSTFSCANCDASYVGNYVDKTEHNYNKKVIPPTCTEHGHSIFMCSDCEASYIDEIVESTNHNYGETVIHATCTSLGYSIFKCSDCEDEYVGNYVDKLPHDYEETIVAATCTGLGHTWYQCKYCDDNHKSDYTEPTGHNPSDWIIDTPATIENAGAKHIECLTCGVTLQSGDIPQLIDEDRSDEDGNASVGSYSIILTDSNNIPVFDSDISIDVNDNISIKLPEGKLLDYKNQLTVTVFHTETQKAASNLQILIFDAADNAATGKTDANGQLKVPNNQSSTGDDNGTIGKDENEEKFTYVVRVSDKENVVIPNCDIYIGESNNIAVDLPDGVKPSVSEPVIVTVTDQNGNPQKDVTIIALGDNDYIEKGKTDVYGRITLPMVSEGFTNNHGHITVDNINVIVNDEIGLIENAFVKHNEDGSISVKLPKDKIISYENRTTITVIDSKGFAIADKIITVTDSTEKTYTNKTNASGKVVFPDENTDYTDESGQAQVNGYSVTVKDEKGFIQNAFVINTKDNKIDIKLPDNLLIDYSNRITVQVYERKTQAPVKDLEITVNEVIVPNESENNTQNPDSSAGTDNDSAEDTQNKNESDKELPAPKSMTGKTDSNGTVVFPPLSEDITDKDGNSGVEEVKPGEDENSEETKTEYKVVVSNTKGVIGDALVKIEDGKVTVTLPDTHTLTTSNQTTVTVTDNEGKAVKGVSVTIKDKNTSKSGTTNSNGKVTLPVKSSGGGGGGYSGGGGSSYSSVTIKIVDKDGKNVSVSRSNGTNISTLTLPAGKNLLKDDNYYTITVTSSSKPKKGYVIALKDRNGNEIKGATNEDGKLIIPGTEHKAYILGYPDGTFRPDGNMTRSEAAAIFARLIAETIGETINGKSSFSDVKSDKWYASYVAYLEKYDVLKGYSDNTFRADNKVTRAEFVAMSVRYYDLLNDLPKVSNTKKYSDVSENYWAIKEISIAKDIGWLNGYADGTFRGDSAITRAEAVTVINRATGRTPDKEYINENYTKLNRFTDVTDSKAWFFYDCLEACNTHSGVSMSDSEFWLD